MKGNSEFTESDMAEIRRLVASKVSSSRGRHKQIRAELADLGFYVSDFVTNPDHPFGPDDLERVIERGKIRVVPDPPKPKGWKRFLAR